MALGVGFRTRLTFLQVPATCLTLTVWPWAALAFQGLVLSCLTWGNKKPQSTTV